MSDRNEDWRKWGRRGEGSDIPRPKAWSPGHPHQSPLAPSWEPLTSVQDDQGSSKLLSRQQPISKVTKPGWSRVGVAAKARRGLSPLWSQWERTGGEGAGGGTHLGSMMEEQLVRFWARELSQKLCSVKPKQMRQELMVRLNLSKKQSRK